MSKLIEKTKKKRMHVVVVHPGTLSVGQRQLIKERYLSAWYIVLGDGEGEKEDDWIGRNILIIPDRKQFGMGQFCEAADAIKKRGVDRVILTGGYLFFCVFYMSTELKKRGIGYRYDLDCVAE